MRGTARCRFVSPVRGCGLLLRCVLRIAGAGATAGVRGIRVGREGAARLRVGFVRQREAKPPTLALCSRSSIQNTVFLVGLTVKLREFRTLIGVSPINQAAVDRARP